MHKPLYLEYDIDVSRKERHTSIDNCVDSSIQKSELYTKKSKERLITAAMATWEQKEKQEKQENKNLEKNNIHSYFK